MSTEVNATPAKRNRRFARLPHDTGTERQAQEWVVDCTPLKACELLLPEIEKGAFLAAGKWQGRYYATMTREEEKPVGFCDAVSGWGKSPAEAIVDLSFRWMVLCRESWYMATHAKLVSERSA